MLRGDVKMENKCEGSALLAPAATIDDSLDALHVTATTWHTWTPMRTHVARRWSSVTKGILSAAVKPCTCSPTSQVGKNGDSVTTPPVTRLTHPNKAKGRRLGGDLYFVLQVVFASELEVRRVRRLPPVFFRAALEGRSDMDCRHAPARGKAQTVGGRGQWKARETRSHQSRAGQRARKTRCGSHQAYYELARTDETGRETAAATL